MLQAMEKISVFGIVFLSILSMTNAQIFEFDQNPNPIMDSLRRILGIGDPNDCRGRWPAPSHPDPEEKMNPAQIAAYYGYPAETHKVHTKDRYILTLFRIPHGRNNAAAGPRPAVFLQHGLLDSASTWVDNPANESFAFILADAGFDVWLGNSRGNTYSREHEVLSPNSEHFWEFSFDEMAEYDLPASIEYVLTNTSQPNLFYAGHSQGTLIAFAKFSSDQRLAAKIKHFFALGPVTNVSHLVSPIKYILPLANTIADAVDLFGHGEFLPNDFIFRFLARYLCGDGLTKPICSNVVFLLAGYDCIHTNETRLPVYIAHTPAGTSAKNMVHFAQLYNSGKCQKFDYGRKANLRIYNQSSPPIYPVPELATPVSLFYGGKDWLADPADVKNLLAVLKNKKDVVYLPEYNHLDFVWGFDARTFIYEKAIQRMRSYARTAGQE